MNLTKEHINLITEYSKGTLNRESFPLNESDNYWDLLVSYLTDKNSSTLREYITCNVLGLNISSKKRGYDSEGSSDEVKPKNVDSSNNKTLNCTGNYSDLTYVRHNKYVKDNPIIHSAGFVDGQLLYIISISYSELSSRFEKLLNKHLPNGDQPSKYVRTADFSFSCIDSNSPNVKVTFIRDDIEKFSSFISKKLYKFLKTKKDSKS